MPLVEVSQLYYRYPQGCEALVDVSLHVDDGECVGLIGPNGAGKSTLLWHLNGLLGADTAEQGRAGQGRGAPAVRIAGLDVNRSNLSHVRRLVGLVFQDPDDQLFCPTLGEDVAYGPSHLGLDRIEISRRTLAALAAVDLAHLASLPPHQLSLGQRKRACLAGVLACEPRLIALDEPTANLDPRARRQLIELLASLDCARLIASHDLEMILALCSRVLVLDEGRVQAVGPTREVFSDERLLIAHGLEQPWSLRDPASERSS